jgi:hypothetical protein
MTDTFKLVRNFLRSLSKDGVIPEDGIPVNATFGGEVHVALVPGEGEDGDNTLVSGKDDDENYVPVKVAPGGQVVIAGANGDGYLPVNVNDDGDLIVDTEGSSISDPVMGNSEFDADVWTALATEPTSVASKRITVWADKDILIRHGLSGLEVPLSSGENIEIATDEVNKVQVKATEDGFAYWVMS